LLLENQRKIGVSNRTPYYVSVHVNNIEPFTSNDLNLIKKIYVTEKDEKRFIEMSKSSGWIDTLVESFAPHIYGLQNVKLGILLSIVGGGNFKVEGTDIRPRIHILICGDPSLAKTKLLKFTHKVVLGSISAIGKGASGGGLTAIVTKETDGSWTVQPGAIVFANKSLFLFDESDKVKDDVRDHLHESMEDGTVTVTKAGQIVTLQAESTTLFASNPKFSRYQDNLPLTENINLPPSLISRFDLVYVLKDNAMYDKQITDHINYIYTNRKIPNKEALLSIEDLTKYFLFVKIQDIDPEFDKDALDVLQDFYFGLRKQNTDDSLATTIRQYEGSLRMCRALARISLSRKITKNYAERIVNLVRSQLDSVMREADGTYNASLLEGKSKSKLVDAGLMRKIMIELEKDYDKHKIPISEIHNILVKEHSMTPKKIDKFLEEMIDQNIISNNGESFVKLSRYS
jgi:replicative DNA helicase Mcm